MEQNSSFKQTYVRSSRLPYLLWFEKETFGEFNGTILKTTKINNEIKEVAEFEMGKSDAILIQLLKYGPVIMLLLIAFDKGYRLWHGIGLVGASLIFLAFFWVFEKKTELLKHFGFAVLGILALSGLFFDVLLYVNYIISYTLGGFFMYWLYLDWYTWKNYKKYFVFKNHPGFYACIQKKENQNRITNSDNQSIKKYVYGALAVGIVMTAVNSYFYYIQYVEDQQKLAIAQKVLKEAQTTPKSVVIKPAASPVQEQNISAKEQAVRQMLDIR